MKKEHEFAATCPCEECERHFQALMAICDESIKRCEVLARQLIELELAGEPEVSDGRH